MTSKHHISDSGLHAVQITPLNHEVMKEIEVDGHYCFKQTRLMDAFGLASSPAEATEAINSILTFNKQLNNLQCDLMKVGFVALPDQDQPGTEDLVGAWHAFTYTVQSRKFQNQPLVVTEAFKMDFPLLALANFTASMWIEAYKRRPQDEIFNVAQGR